jgi:hypothetical protein
MENKLKLQQQKVTALEDSNAHLEQQFQDCEERRDNEITIILQTLNKHSY